MAHLPETERHRPTDELIDARRAVKAARTTGDSDAEDAAHRGVDAAKHALGERGPVWWDDGAANLSRKVIRNTDYAAWYEGVKAQEGDHE